MLAALLVVAGSKGCPGSAEPATAPPEVPWLGWVEPLPWEGCDPGRWPPPSERTADPAVVERVLCKDAVDHGFREGLFAFRKCYVWEPRDRMLSDRIGVRFGLTSDGHPTSVEVTSSTFTNTTVESCVLQALDRLVFSLPAAPVRCPATYEHVIRFSPPY
jgi:hypothetical protein